MAELIAAVTRAGTVNLNRLAPHIASDAKTASVHRRQEQLFGEVQLNDAEGAQATVAMLGLCGKPWHPAMDRTNWKLARTDLNILDHAARGPPDIRRNAGAWRRPAHRPVRGGGLAASADRDHAVGNGRIAGAGQPDKPKAGLSSVSRAVDIESMFGALKTRCFNLEAPYMTDLAKLSTLKALLTLAAALACKAGLALARCTPIRRKAHGRLARSLFAHGLDAIRKIFAQRGSLTCCK
jgi:hypothetical protein